MPAKISLHPRTLVFTVVITMMLIFSVSVNVFAADEGTALFLPSVQSPKPLPSSWTLIDLAYQQGQINEETAILYRVYADFEDPRLPAEYRGDDSQVGLSMAVYDAQARFATLSPAVQSHLAPFFVPPLADNSWHEQREIALEAGSQTGGAQLSVQVSPGSELASEPAASNAKITWLTTCQTDPNIKVWYQERYPEDAVGAQQVCELVRGEIWPRLVSLMGRAPLDDGAEANNGGDAQLDFYLVNANTGAVGYRGCDNTPSHIYVNRTRWNKELLTAAVMGAFLNGYDSADCLEYMWLYAASRTWSIDHVYPQSQWEHTYADDFLMHTDMPLDTYPVIPLDAQNQVGDGAYLWVWWAANLVKTPQTTVPLFWEGAMNPDSLAAVNNVMGADGFENRWKNFSGLNWNNEPVDVYKELDGMPHSTKLTLDEAVTLDGGQDRTWELEADVMMLSAHTFRFKFTDPEVRSVLFYNPFKGGDWPTAAVQAYFMLEDGSWHIEDWTAQDGKSFCRDLVAERVEELVVVISNHEWQDPAHKLQPAKPVRLNATNIACRGWEFEGTATWTGTGDQYSVEDTATIKATFTRQVFSESPISSLDFFQVTEGTGTWSHTGHFVNCAGSESGTFEVSGGNNTGLYVLAKATDHATSTEYMPGDRRYSGFGGEGTQADKLTTTYYCNSAHPPYEVTNSSAVNWFLAELITDEDQLVSADGKEIKGSRTNRDDDGMHVDTHTWEWTMTALPPE